MSRQEIEHVKTVHVSRQPKLDTFLEERLGAVEGLLESAGANLFHWREVQVLSSAKRFKKTKSNNIYRKKTTKPTMTFQARRMQPIIRIEHASKLNETTPLIPQKESG